MVATPFQKVAIPPLFRFQKVAIPFPKSRNSLPKPQYYQGLRELYKVYHKFFYKYIGFRKKKFVENSKNLLKSEKIGRRLQEEKKKEKKAKGKKGI
jgi:hypothetical protein